MGNFKQVKKESVASLLQINNYFRPRQFNKEWYNEKKFQKDLFRIVIS